VLLDTNALIWAQQGSPRLGRNTARRLEQAGAIYFSPISVLEVEIKTMRKNMAAAKNFYTNLLADGFTEIKLSGLHAEAIREFTSLALHDPFDRVLLATAAYEKMNFVTSDRKILDLNLSYVIDAQD
jgi:PIN domain nuclease of toxin-antitoxin system